MDEPGATPEALLEQCRRALRASEARFRNIIEKNADGVLVVRHSGVICYVNAAAEALLGRPRGELIGEPFGTPVIPGETTEVDVLRPGDEVRVAEMRGVEVAWEGEPAFLASLRDTTERKRAEEELRFLAEAGRVLAGSLDYPTTLASLARLAVPHLADGCVIDMVEEDRVVRPAAIAHADPSKEEWVRELQRRHPTPLTAPEVVPRVLRTGRPVVFPALAGSAAAGEAEHPRLLRKLGFRSYLCVPLVARGRTLGTITLVMTASGRRFSPADLGLAEELARRAALAVDNARLYDESLEAVRRRDEFLALLAHELRNPLAPILSAAEVMARRGLNDPPLRRARDVVERQGRHLARLLDDLLDISRVTRGRIELRKERVELAAVAADAVQTSRPLIDARGHVLTVSLPPEPLPLEADPTRLGQVLANLLNNAAKYTEEGGRIWLIAERDAGEVVIRVRDTGVGIPPALLTRVFEPFMQVEQTLARSQGGLGIGLTLVRRLVEMHGGSVVALSEGEGKGSEFLVRLPLAACAPVPPEADRTPEGGAARRILIVEDNRDSREMLRDLLELWGHRVEAAADGAEGLKAIQVCPPEVALVDIGLPTLDGYQLARKVRSAETTRHVFLVALTGYGQKDDRRRTREAGFDAHLVKPVDLNELAQLLSSERANAAGRAERRE